jgi:hypothetical protein
MSSEAEDASVMFSLRRWSEEVLNAVAEDVIDILPTCCPEPDVS